MSNRKVVISMATYTITVDSLIASGYQIFDESWSTFDPGHKAELCDKIIAHYRFNEIGAETPARFKHYLNTQLREIMPYYNMLYETALQDMLPLYNIYTETSVAGKERTLANAVSSGRTDRKQLQYMAASLKTMANTDETTDSTQDTTGHKGWSEHDTRKLTEGETTDTTYGETWSETEDVTKDTTNKVVGTEDETKKDQFTRDTTTTKHQDTTGQTSGSKSEYSSDTPQGSIVNGQLSIDSRYLTKYQHASESASSTGTLNENGTTKEVFDNDVTRNVDTTQDTTDKVVTDRDASGKKDSTTNVDRNLTANENIDKTGTEDTIEKIVGNVHGVTDQTGKQFQDSSTDTSGSDTTARASETDSTKQNDATTITKGNINITRSELIRKYRDNYLNVDLMIIAALVNNFMGVF